MNLLDEELGQSVLLVGGSFTNISLGRGIDQVADSETLNSLVLGDASTTVVASEISNVTAVVLRSTVVSTLDRHLSRN